MTEHDHTTFTIPEVDVARRLGLPLDEIRERRGVRDHDWSPMGRGHRVAWTESAVLRLASQIDPCESGATKGADAEKPASSLVPAAAEVVTVILTRTRMRNTRIVIGRVSGAEEGATDVTVIVGVDRAKWFTAGMAVLARRREGALYDFEGDPARPEKGRLWPRRPGHW